MPKLVKPTASYSQDGALCHSKKTIVPFTKKGEWLFGVGGQPTLSTLLIKKHTLRDEDFPILDLISFYSYVDIVLKCPN